MSPKTDHLSRITEPDRLIRLQQILELTALSRATIYRMIAAGDFPEPTKFGSASRWHASVLAEFIAARRPERSISKASRATRPLRANSHRAFTELRRLGQRSR